MAGLVINPYRFTPTDVWGTVFNAAITGNAGGNSTITVRHLFQIAALTVPTNTPTKVRLTYKAGTLEPFEILSSYIGQKAAAGDPYDFSTTPTQILFTGSGTGVVPQSGTLLSDEINFSWDKTSDLIISWYNNNGAQDSSAFLTGVTNTGQYTKAANDPSTVDATGYTLTGSNRLDLLQKIEMNGF